MIKKIAIIGAGATGVAAFIGLVRNKVAVDIELIDPINPGVGIAFNHENDNLICNTSPDTMSLIPDSPNDFIEYMEGAGVKCFEGYFPPRYLYRNYVIARYHEYLIKAQQQSIEVNFHPESAIKIGVISTKKYVLTLSSGTNLDVDGVIISTGCGKPLIPKPMQSLQKYPSFYQCLNDLVNQNTIPKDSKVLIVGSKLSAIDSAILASNKGCQVTMISPSGVLPAVRTGTPLPQNRLFHASDLDELDFESPHIARHIYKLISKRMKSNGIEPLKHQVSYKKIGKERLLDEIKISKNRENYWQSFIVELVDATNEALTSKSNNLKNRILSSCNHFLERYLGSVSLDNAEKILKLMEEGKLEVRKGEIKHIRNINGRWQITLIAGESETYDFIICAAGYEDCKISASSKELVFKETSHIGYNTLFI